MTLLSDIESQILLRFSIGPQPRRIRVPESRRAELEREMRLFGRGKTGGEIPLHIMGLMVYFDGDDVAIEPDLP